ncbi:MAG: hypothetical protein M3328_13400 [Chloroflexota bacterium]|nr:hypothetical protein [Chloroflexota bacterium]
MLELNVYERSVRAILSHDEQIAIEDDIAHDAKNYPVIPGTGGIRKARASRGNKGSASIVVVRLQAPLPTILQRLRRRESGASLAWHEQRADELARLMEEQAAEDLLIETEGKTVEEVAREVLTRTGWVSTIDV